MTERNMSVTTLERSAFWIYGVTAMILREPLGIVLRHGSTAGWSDPVVRLEVLRTVLVLVLLSRLFLGAGLHFENVYMKADAGELYPRRNYPVDFLTGMLQLLIGVAASTAIALHTGTSGPSMFGMLAGAVLLSDAGWLLLAGALRYSALPRMARRAAVGTAIAAAGALAAALTQSEMAALGVLLLLAALDMSTLVGEYASQ